MPLKNYPELTKLLDTFELDVPLSNETFSALENLSLRKKLLQKSSFILLDNSKGRGIQEDPLQLRKKIIKLDNFGFKNIMLMGGFGPKNLQNYFQLCKEFNILFSTDAESRLKTCGIFDMEKTILYLEELIGFSECFFDSEQK